MYISVTTWFAGTNSRLEWNLPQPIGTSRGWVLIGGGLLWTRSVQQADCHYWLPRHNKYQWVEIWFVTFHLKTLSLLPLSVIYIIILSSFLCLNYSFKWHFVRKVSFLDILTYISCRHVSTNVTHVLPVW